MPSDDAFWKQSSLHQLKTDFSTAYCSQLRFYWVSANNSTSEFILQVKLNIFLVDFIAETQRTGDLSTIRLGKQSFSFKNNEKRFCMTDKHDSWSDLMVTQTTRASRDEATGSMRRNIRYKNLVDIVRLQFLLVPKSRRTAFWIPEF